MFKWIRGLLPSNKEILIPTEEEAKDYRKLMKHLASWDRLSLSMVHAENRIAADTQQWHLTHLNGWLKRRRGT